MRIARLQTPSRPRPVAPPDRTNRYQKPDTWPWGDKFEPDRRISLRRTLALLDEKIAAANRAIDDARRRRDIARRLVVVMTVATVATSLAALLLTVGALVPLAPAMWVVPSALGGSAVGQSAAAMRESVRIRDCEAELAALALAKEILLRRIDMATTSTTPTPPEPLLNVTGGMPPSICHLSVAAPCFLGS